MNYKNTDFRTIILFLIAAAMVLLLLLFWQYQLTDKPLTMPFEKSAIWVGGTIVSLLFQKL